MDYFTQLSMPMLAYIGLYLLALCCYFYTRTAKSLFHRALNKYLLASMYLGLAIFIFFRDYVFVSYQTFLMVAFLLAWLGDVFLVFDFNTGGNFFLAGNICFTVYEQIVLVEHGYDYHSFWMYYLIAAGILLLFILAHSLMPNVLKLGKLRWPMTFYFSSILVHGCTGLALVMLLPGSNFMIMGIGSLLFLVSDIVLILSKFVFAGNKWLIRLNSLTYFVGMMTMVLSTLVF